VEVIKITWQLKEGKVSMKISMSNQIVILVGDSNVGKTCMFMRVSRNLFTNNYKPTIGLDFNFEYYEVFGTPFTISLWDTAGQERFKSLTKAYYRGAHAAIIAFSLNEPETLSNVTNWIAEVRQFAEEQTLKIFLVGTKCDLLNVVDRKDAESIAIENEAEYWEVSAKTDVNVKPLFDRVAYLVWETQLRRWKANSEKKVVTEEEFQAPASLTSGKPPTKSSCCKL
jgi:small GTP-binding protein